MSSFFQFELPKTFKRGSRVRAGSGVFVTGDKELDAILDQVEPRMAKRLQREELKKAAKQIILPEAQARVPVDSGQLEESLVARALPRSRTRYGYEVRTRDGFFKGDEFYGGFIEFGTKHQEADPFLRPAGYGNEQRIRTMVVGGVKQAIKKLPVSPVR